MGIPKFSLGQLVPDYVCVMHRYQEVFAMPMSAITAAAPGYVFRWNDLYDPNLSGTGHQPFYFDTMNSLYSNYIVTDAEAWVHWYPNTLGSLGQAVVIGYNTPPTITGPAGYAPLLTDLFEDPQFYHSKFGFVSGTNGDWKWAEKMKMEWHLAEHDPTTPITEHLVNLDAWCGSGTGAAANICGLNLRGAYANAGFAAASLSCWITIRYKAVWGWPSNAGTS